jgi:hypothetical protein
LLERAAIVNGMCVFCDMHSVLSPWLFCKRNNVMFQIRGGLKNLRPQGKTGFP